MKNIQETLIIVKGKLGTEDKIYSNVCNLFICNCFDTAVIDELITVEEKRVAFRFFMENKPTPYLHEEFYNDGKFWQAVSGISSPWWNGGETAVRHAFLDKLINSFKEIL